MTQPVQRTWAGLRPATPDGRPILGREPEVERLWYATGHGRSGILLAALTGEITADLRSEEHTSELQSQSNLVCRLLLGKKKRQSRTYGMYMRIRVWSKR